MHISKSFGFFMLIICSTNHTNAMHQKHGFDITKFNEINYRQEISKVHPCESRDFLMDQLVDSMVLIFELKQHNIDLQEQLAAQEQLRMQRIRVLTKLHNSLNDSKEFNRQLVNQNKSLQILNNRLYNKIEQDKIAFNKRLQAIQCLSEKHSI